MFAANAGFCPCQPESDHRIVDVYPSADDKYASQQLPRDVLSHAKEDGHVESSQIQHNVTHSQQTPHVAKAWTPFKDTVLQWFLECSETDACWFLTNAFLHRKAVFAILEPNTENDLSDDGIIDSEHASKSTDDVTLLQASHVATLSTMSTKGGYAAIDTPDSPISNTNTDRSAHRHASILQMQEELRNEAQRCVDTRAADGAAARKEDPIVQFSAPIYFCNDKEGEMVIDVVRMGNLDLRSEVSYTTVDGSAKHGAKYTKTSGKLVFEPGVNELAVRIPIIRKEIWDITTEFSVQLQQEGAQKCIVGKYLWTSRVKVFKDDVFPSNRYAEDIKLGFFDGLPQWTILWQYYILAWRSSRIVSWGSMKTCLVGQVINLVFLAELYLDVWLIDVVLRDPNGDGSRLVIIAASMVLPFFLIHFLQVRKLTWKVSGTLRGALQNALVTKFLNYDEQSRATLPQGELVMALTRAAPATVELGYMKIFEFTDKTGRLAMILIFVLTAPQVLKLAGSNSERTLDWLVLVFLAFIPMILLIFLLCRGKRTRYHIEQQITSQKRFVGQVERIIAFYRMVADYNRRPFFEERCKNLVSAYNKAWVDAGMVVANNNHAAPWLGLLSCAIYVVIGGLRLREKKITLGMYLAGMASIKEIGAACGEVYKALLDMQEILPELMDLIQLINKPIDLPQRLALNRERRSRSKEIREQLRAEMQMEGGLPIDFLPISVTSLRHSCNNLTGKLEIQQGQMVSLVGPQGQGKSTLLKILGAVVLPEPGGFFVPSHLRCLHLSPEPLFFLGTLYANLTFGCQPGDPDSRIERVSNICRMVRLPEWILDIIGQEADGPSKLWGECLSQTQKSLLCFVRGLVANPELLCIQKPTMSYDEISTTLVYRMLRKFCAEKGVEQDPSRCHMRRPRTCIFTTSKILGVECCDRVFHVSAKDGIKEIQKDEVDTDMLA
eukprot:TRINITY_DN57737_c0_g1_i1.p1 TRINITY_DN57737_c0_g1~~TRINITY_DN57737_c0_g1_i1.p1  ORF type:complete len:960 (-),score=119.58 TRINITY_DN57737_c0_g1_i1:36-2885(-)